MVVGRIFHEREIPNEIKIKTLKLDCTARFTKLTTRSNYCNLKQAASFGLFRFMKWSLMTSIECDWATGSTVWGSVHGKARWTSCLQNVQTGCGAHLPSTGILGEEVMRPECKADHYHRLVRMLTNEWSCNATPSTCLLVMYSHKLTFISDKFNEWRCCIFRRSSLLLWEGSWHSPSTQIFVAYWRRLTPLHVSTIRWSSSGL